MKKLFFMKWLLILMFPLVSTYGASYYVAPDGNDSNNGSQSSPFATLAKAIDVVSPGDYIYLRGGTYNMPQSSVVIDRSKSGSSGAMVHVFAFNGETPILSFDNIENTSSRGIVQDAHYWHWKGVIIEKAGDNGMLLSANNCIIESCVFRRNRDSGLQLSRYNTSYNSISEWPSNNTIIGCESYDNRDSGNENADGFAAKLTCGTGNVFKDCVAHHNIDDGWDLYTKSSTGPIGVVKFENCIAHNNGKLTDGTTSGNGDKNGFKLGSSAHNINHELRRCIAFNNGKHGFTDNGNVGNIKFYNLTSYNNGDYNYHTRDNASHTFRNCITYQGNHTDRIVGDAPVSCNALDETDINWTYVTKASDFQTLTPGPNNAPTSNGFLNLASGSQFIDAGCSASGVTGNGTIDIGAIEYGGTTPPPPPPPPGTYTLSTNVTGSGTVSGGGTYNEGATATVTANPASGWTFTNWSGDASGTNATTTVYMNGDKSVTAVFTQDGGTTPPPPTGDEIHNFTASGLNSSFYNISGNLSTTKGTVTYDGLTLTQCLKIESSTSITFTSAQKATLTLVFNEGWSGSFVVNGSSQNASNGILTIDLAAGSHTLTKGDVANLYYMSLVYEGTTPPPPTNNITVRARGKIGGEQIELKAGGSSIGTWTLTTGMADYSASGSGDVQVHFINDNGPYDVQVDYVIKDGVTMQAEDQAVNTGVWQDNSCGGSYSEWLHCGGYIDFGGTTPPPTTITIQENTTGFCGVDGTIDSNHSGFTGDGFANTDNASGTGVNYKINVGTAGNYDIEIQYANGSTDRPADIIANGSVVGNVSMPGTGSWATWASVSKTVTLNAGVQDLRLQATDGNGLGNLDFIKITGAAINAANCGTTPPPNYTLSTNVTGSGSVTGGGTYAEGTVVTVKATPSSGWKFDNWSGSASGTNATTTVTMTSNKSVTANFSESSTPPNTITIQENTTGFCGVEGTIDNNHSGFTGDGFANTDNAAGTGIDYKINVSNSGSYTLEIQYANGSSDRPADIIANGSVVGNVSMPGTGSWATWTSVSKVVTLNAGEQNLRLQATGGSGLGNIDYLKITGPGIAAASCGGGTTQYTLSTNVTGNGSVSLSPSGGTYDAGTVVTLTATPAADYVFSNWSGDASGTSATTSVTMNANKSVTAVFNFDGGGGTANFALAGWATEAGGTTGGHGGPTETVTNGQDLQDAIDKGGPRIIYVQGKITSAPDGKFNVKDVSDISILGLGSTAELDNVGIKITRASNIIIRNLKIHSVLTGEKDAISIEGPANHIWVDHCELYAEYDGVHKDYYDGLLDAKGDVDYLTFSWNYMHDSWKTSLAGSSESDTYDRKMTLHHNYYRNCYSRLPLFRGGNGHVFNCYYEDIHSTAINSRLGACVKVENNYFLNTKNPWVSAYSKVLGGVDASGNTFVNSPFDFSNSDINEALSCNAHVPYSYSSVLNSTSQVPNIVKQYAGVGKLSDPASFSVVKSGGEVEYYNANSIQQGFAQFGVYPNPVQGQATIAFELMENGKVNISLFDMTGKMLGNLVDQSFDKGYNEIGYQFNMPKGVYILKAQIGNTVENTRIIIE
jgi:pectate lyase